MFKRGNKDKSDSDKEVSYRDQLRNLGEISTIEQFFSYYTHLKKVEDIPKDTDLYFFRANEVPMWEESPDGGIWITKVRRDDNVALMWESLLLALIGEHFGDTNVIGVSISIRQRDTLI